MADFYSSIFQTIKPLDPVDYLYKEQEARLKEAENKRQQEELEFNRRQQARADEYLKVAKSQDERNLEKYQREIEANRSIGNLYKEYQKTNKPLDMYGQFGQDLQSTLIDKGLTKEAIRIAEKRAAKFEQDADDNLRYQRSLELIERRRTDNIGKLKIQSFPDTTGEKVQYQVDSNGNPVNVWNPEKRGWEPIAAKLQEEQQQGQSSGWGEFWGGFADPLGFGSKQSNPQVSPNKAQSVADIKAAVASGAMSPKEEEAAYALIDSQPDQAAPVSVPQEDRGSFDPWSVITAPAAGIDQFLGSQLGGASHFIGDAIGKTGLFPETAQAINQFGDIQEGFGNSAKKRFGVDTGAENLLSDLTGAGAGIAKQVGTYTLGGPLAVAGAMFPEIKNTAMQIANAGGGQLEQARGAATQGLIDTLGGSLASKYIKGTGWLGGALAEGTTEGLQELASIGLVDRTTALPDPTAREAGQRVSYNTLLGMFGGGVAGSLAGRSRSGGDIDPSIPEGLAAGEDTSKIVVDGIPIQNAIGFTERLGLPYSTKITPDDVYYQGGPDQPQLFLPAPEVKPIGKRSQLSAPTAEEVLTPIRRPWEHSGEPILIRDGIQSLSDSYQTSEGLYIPSQAEVELYRESDDGKILTELPQVLKPTADVIQDVSKIGDLSDYYEPKPVGTFEQSLATGGDILPSKIGGFDFSGNKISKGGILTPEVKLDTQVGPRIATDPTGFELRIPLSEKGVTTRAEIDTFFKGRFGSQRGAVRLTTPVASTPAGKFVVSRQSNIEKAVNLGVDKYFNTNYLPEGMNDTVNAFTQNATFLTTAAQEWRNQIDNPDTPEADRYYAKKAWEAANAILNQGDAFHSSLTPMAQGVAEFSKFKEPVRKVAATAIKQAQIAKATQPNFDYSTFYDTYKVPVGKNQFRLLTTDEKAAIISHKKVTDLAATQLVDTQVAVKQNKLQIERRKVARALKSVSPRIPQLDVLRLKNQPLPADLTPAETVGLQTLQMFDADSATILQAYRKQLNVLRDDLQNSPYSPMMRQGKYAVVMTDENNKQLYFALKDKKRDRDSLVKQLAQRYPQYKIKPYKLSDDIADRAAVSLGSVTGAIAKAEKLANFNQLTEKLKSRVPNYTPGELHDISVDVTDMLGALGNELGVSGQGMLTHLLPADAILKSTNPISGQPEYVPLPGYEEDPAKALMMYAKKSAYFNSRIITESAAKAKIESLPESSDSRKFLSDRLNRQMGTPGFGDKVISGVQQMHILSTLGFKVSTAINSGVGVMLVTYPNISSLNGLRRKKGLSSVNPEATTVNSARLAVNLMLPGGDKIIQKYAKSNNPKLTRLASALKMAGDEGIFGFDASTEWQGMEWQDKSDLQKVTEKAMKMFTMSEHMANRTSFIAHFNALDGVYPNVNDQYQAAKNWMRSVNPYNTKGNRPGFSQGVGRVPTAFRMYSGQQLRLWRTWLGAAAKGDKDGAAAVARAFAGILAVIGVNGVPFAQEAIKMAQGFTGESPRKEVEDATNELVADGLFYGGLTAVGENLGIPMPTLSGSLGAGEWLPNGKTWKDTMASLVLGSYSRYPDAIDRTQQAVERGDYLQAGQEVVQGLNSAAGAAFKSGRAAIEGKYVDSRGKPLRGRDGKPVKPNVANTAMGAIGLQPFEKAIAGQINYEKNLRNKR